MHHPIRRAARPGAPLAVIAVLERRYPAGPNGGLFTVGAAQDAVYFALFFVFQLTIVRLYFVLLAPVAQLLPHAHLEGVLGATGAVIVAFFIGDLLNWAMLVKTYARRLVYPFRGPYWTAGGREG